MLDTATGARDVPARSSNEGQKSQVFSRGPVPVEGAAGRDVPRSASL
jgi:hypothetical protein